MDENNSPATEAGEEQPDRSHEKSQARIVGVHPLYLLLPRQIPFLLSPTADSIPVTGEPEETIYTSRFVTPYIRQDPAYPAGSVPPMVLDPLEGLQGVGTDR